jgi:hypothetical protein
MKISNLMTASGDKITMPFSPGETAKSIARHFEGGLFGLHRIDFPRTKDYQEDDADGITANDHLLVSIKFFNTLLFVVAVDTGIGLTLLATFDTVKEHVEYNQRVHTTINYLGFYDKNWFKEFFFSFKDEIMADLKKLHGITDSNEIIS